MKSLLRIFIPKIVSALFALVCLHSLEGRQALLWAVSLPNDPLFNNQWHLYNTGQSGGMAGADINVASYWNFAESKNLGSGVNIAIVDDGLQHTHPDLSPNYQPELSFDFNRNAPNPMPNPSDNRHGTAVAGIAAARGNNGQGITGVAPLAGLSGIRLTATLADDKQIADALTFQNNNQGGRGTNHIYNNSWGPSDKSPTLMAPEPLTKAALANGTAQGRDGKGSIFVWVGGNGGAILDNSNYDGFANSRYVIAVGATNNLGTTNSYSEPGANLLVNAPVGNGTSAVATTDLMDFGTGYNPAAMSQGGGYTNNDFAGTSAAAPQVSGVAALMLEANPNLGWRDVKHILVHTAVQNDPTHPDWTTNAAGLHVNHTYGFGRVDAAAAATMAATWNNVEPENVASATSANLNLLITDGTGSTFGAPQFGNPTSNSLLIDTPIKIETVEVTVNVSHTYRGQLEFTLVAPSGTESILGTPRNDPDDHYSNWTFTTVRNWDEIATGEWTLQIRDGIASTTGMLNSWSLNVYGTLVPEPHGFMLLGLGLLSMSVIRSRLPLRRRRSRFPREPVR